jgi:hypothetical protein
MNPSIFAPLLGQLIVSLDEIVVHELQEKHSPKDSVIFQVAGGAVFQFLVSHTRKILRRCSGPLDLLIDGDYGPNRRAERMRLDVPSVELPLSVTNVTEIWAGGHRDSFLLGFILSDDTGRGLSACTGGDELEFMTEEQLFKLARQVLPQYRIISVVHYDQVRPLAD